MFKIFKKPKRLNFESSFAVIQSTDSATNSFVNDKFNKKICIYKDWDSYLKRKPIKSYPFTEIDAKNFKEKFRLPMISEDLEINFEFIQGENFGEITNRIR